MKKNNRKTQRVYQRENIIKHGNYMSVYSFPVFESAYKRTGGRRKAHATSEVQKKYNQKLAENKLTYIINENFNENDIEMGLGFDDEYLPESYEEALKHIQNFIRRIKYYRRTHGLSELKYVYVVQKGERRGRWHYHMILSGGMSRDMLERMWRMGYAHTYALYFDKQGLRGLAKYKIRPDDEVIEGKFKRWCASKNLSRPQPKERTGYISRRTVEDIRKGNITERELERIYPGYEISEVNTFHNPCNGGEYLEIQLYRKRDYSRRRLE